MNMKTLSLKMIQWISKSVIIVIVPMKCVTKQMTRVF